MTDHAVETAMSYLAATVIDTHGDDDRKVAIAQVHATLALAEQQRIANIIALATPQEIPGHGQGTASIPSYGTDGILRADIATALGLTPTTPNQEQDR